MDDPAFGVERLERRRGRLEKRHLELVIVLDHEEIVLGRPFEQPPSPRERHRHACRAMVARCREHDVRARGHPLGVETLAVDLDRLHAAPRLVQDIAEPGVARRLGHRRPSLREQDLRREPERILRAQRHEDFLGFRDDPATRQ